MPLIEIDDATHTAMTQNGIKFQDRTAAQQAAERELALIRGVMNGPDRLELLKMVKKQHPEMNFPEIDAAKPHVDAMEEFRKEFRSYVADQKKEKEEQAQRDREAAANKTVDQGRAWLKREKKMDEDGIKAVEQIMQDDGIPNYNAAFLLWRERNPPDAAELPPIRGNNLDWFRAETEDQQKDMKLRLTDPIAYRQRRIPQLLQQLRRGEIDEFGRPVQRAA